MCDVELMGRPSFITGTLGKDKMQIKIEDTLLKNHERENEITPHNAFSQGQSTLMPSDKWFLESFPPHQGGGNSGKRGKRHSTPHS